MPANHARPASGAWPVMLTPFAEDRSIDWSGVDSYTDWLIEHRAAGIFTVSLSSEMYHLSAEERFTLAAHVADRVSGRVPVIASAIAAADADAQIAEVRRMHEAGVDSVVLIGSLVAGQVDDDVALRERMLRIVDGTGDIPLGVYECPVPYKRLLPTPLLVELAQTGRFGFFKDTSHSVALMTERIAAVEGTGLAHFNAEISSLRETVRAGGAGFSGYAANVYPDLVDWLCRHANETSDAVTATQRVLTIAEHAINAAYPTTAKYFLAERAGLGIRAISRSEPSGVGTHAGEPLIELARFVSELGLPGLVERDAA